MFPRASCPRAVQSGLWQNWASGSIGVPPEARFGNHARRDARWTRAFQATIICTTVPWGATRAALATLVHAISRLDATLHWGEGRTSASDGQRFALPRKVLQQTYSTRFSDFALEVYSFVADNYAPFYSTPIECTDRDAAFVLDGLLYNESDLELEEHYTDTHGYTEINFAAFAMLGRRF